MNLPDLPEALTLAIIFFAVPVTWAVTVLLYQMVLGTPSNRALKAWVAFALSIAMIVTVFSIIFVNNGMQEPFFSTRETQIITRSSLLVLSTIPALFWLNLVYRANGKRK